MRRRAQQGAKAAERQLTGWPTSPVASLVEDEAEASGEMIGKTALEAWTTAAEGGNVYVVRSFVAKTASDRTKFPAMTPHVGVIQSYNGQTGLFRVSYADGDSEDMDADEATNCMV